MRGWHIPVVPHGHVGPRCVMASRTGTWAIRCTIAPRAELRRGACRGANHDSRDAGRPSPRAARVRGRFHPPPTQNGLCDPSMPYGWATYLRKRKRELQWQRRGLWTAAGSAGPTQVQCGSAVSGPAGPTQVRWVVGPGWRKPSETLTTEALTRLAAVERRGWARPRLAVGSTQVGGGLAGWRTGVGGSTWTGLTAT
jgi:hypothetical protein